MRILFCLDTDKNLTTLGARLSKVLNLFNEDLYYIDVLHIYEKPKADAPHMPATMLDIQKDEEKTRMKFIAKCQGIVQEILEKKLKKAALVNSHLIQGKFFKKLQEHVRYHKYELIVLLPGKKPPVELFLKGRNVNKIISKLDIPILVLPKQSSFEFRKTKFIGMLEKPKKQHKLFKKNRILRQIKPDLLNYLHICSTGMKEYEDVHILNHSDRIMAFEDFHNDRRSNHIYVLNHKPKKGVAKWRKSSFTKTVLTKSDAAIMVI